jgi:hypothetical protein
MVEEELYESEEERNKNELGSALFIPQGWGTSMPPYPWAFE